MTIASDPSSSGHTPAGTDILHLLGFGYDGTGGDWAYGPGGGLLRVAGLALLQQRFGRRLATPKGALLLHPTYGASLCDRVGTPIGDADVALLAQEVEAELLADAIVAAVSAVDVASDPGTGDLWVTPTVQLRGSGVVVDVPLVFDRFGYRGA